MMLKAVLPSKKIDWQSMTVQSEWDVGFPIEIVLMQASIGITELVLSNFRYRMYRYLDNTGKFKIGYGFGNPDSIYGYTEQESFAAFMKEFKKKERELKTQLPLITISQTRFDALLSLYFQTGTWKIVKSDSGIYDLYSAILEERWNLVSDMIANGNEDRQMRFAEARVMQLADYGTSRDRFWLNSDGIYNAREAYRIGIDDPIAKKQVEVAYYRITGTFLPGIPELRKREIHTRLPESIIQS